MKCVFFLLVSLLCSSVQAQDSSGLKRYRLVDIFCTAFTEQQTHPEKFTELEKIWTVLEKNFQAGELFSVSVAPENRNVEFQEIKTSNIFQKCVEQNRSDFELGEFILSGLEIVRNSLKAYQSQPNLQISSASFPMDKLEEGGPEMQIEITSLNSQVGNLKEVNAVIVREKKYSQLWQQFIQSLKLKNKLIRF